MVTGGSLSLRKEAGAGAFVALDLYCEVSCAGTISEGGEGTWAAGC